MMTGSRQAARRGELACALLGRPSDEVIGRTAEELGVSHLVSAGLAARLAVARETGADCGSREPVPLRDIGSSRTRAGVKSATDVRVATISVAIAGLDRLALKWRNKRSAARSPQSS